MKRVFVFTFFLLLSSLVWASFFFPDTTVLVKRVDLNIGDLNIAGDLNVGGIAGDGVGKVVCVRDNGVLGTCIDMPGDTGVCTCG